MRTPHALHRYKATGMACLVSTLVTDLTSPHYCSEQGHTEGSSIREWNVLAVPGCHISTANLLSLKRVHRQTDRQTCKVQHHSLPALFLSLHCQDRSSLFIAARVQSHSHSAERLLLLKAHNNRTMTLSEEALDCALTLPLTIKVPIL